jgi:serine/threonine protein kinase
MGKVFHSKNFIHRDIKPENFVIGRDDISLIYLIDFGLSKYYRNAEGKHIDFIPKKGMIGTARYASINALQEME